MSESKWIYCNDCNKKTSPYVRSNGSSLLSSFFILILSIFFFRNEERAIKVPGAAYLFPYFFKGLLPNCPDKKAVFDILAGNGTPSDSKNSSLIRLLRLSRGAYLHSSIFPVPVFGTFPADPFDGDSVRNYSSFRFLYRVIKQMQSTRKHPLFGRERGMEQRP